MATTDNNIQTMEQNIKAFMQEHKLEKFPVFFDEKGGKEYLGRLCGDDLYFSSYIYKVSNRQWLLEQAQACISIYEQVISQWNKEITAQVDYYSDYEKKRTEEWNDTFDKVCEKMERSNNRLRYCNGSYYKFADKQLEQDYVFWYHLISENRAFHLYYGNGIVD